MRADPSLSGRSGCVGRQRDARAVPTGRGRLSTSRGRAGRSALVFAEYLPPYMGSDRRLFDLTNNLRGWRVAFVVIPPLRALVSGDRAEEALRRRCDWFRGSHLPEKCGAPSEEARPDPGAHYLRLGALLWNLWRVGPLPVAYACTIPGLIVQSVRLIRQAKPDLVVAGHPSYLCGLVAVLAARIAGAPVLLDYPDAWTPLAIDTAGLSPSSATARMLFAIESFIAQRADRITAITAQLAEYVADVMKATAPIAIVGNGGDDLLFVSDTEPMPRAALNIPADHAIAVYSGRLESWSGTAALAEAIKIVTTQRPKTTFLILGDGNAADLLRRAISAEHLEGHTVFAGQRPAAEMPRLVALADVAIVPFPRTLTTEVCAPIKLYEYMLMKKAVVTTSLAGIRESVSGDHVHFIAEPTPGTLSGAILSLLDRPGYRAALAHRGYELAKKSFTWDLLGAQFAIEMHKAANAHLPARAQLRGLFVRPSAAAHAKQH